MNVNVIDIDDIFQSHTFIMSPVRPANKFVILKNSDELILITGKINKFPYHALLIEWFCNKNNIAFSWSHKPDFLDIFGSDHTICGGGYVKFNQDKQKYEFNGFSTAYGRFDAKKLNNIIEKSPILDSHRILVLK